MAEHPVALGDGVIGVVNVVDFVEGLVQFLVLTLDVFVKVGEFNGLEVIEVHLGLLLILEIVVVLGDIVLAWHDVETICEGCTSSIRVEFVVE